MSELHSYRRKISLEWIPRTETPETDETQGWKLDSSYPAQRRLVQGRASQCERDDRDSRVFEMREISAGKSRLELPTLVVYGRN